MEKLRKSMDESLRLYSDLDTDLLGNTGSISSDSRRDQPMPESASAPRTSRSHDVVSSPIGTLRLDDFPIREEGSRDSGSEGSDDISAGSSSEPEGAGSAAGSLWERDLKLAIIKDALLTYAPKILEREMGRSWSNYFKEKWPGSSYADNDEISPQLRSLRDRINKININKFESYADEIQKAGEWLGRVTREYLQNWAETTPDKDVGNWLKQATDQQQDRFEEVVNKYRGIGERFQEHAVELGELIGDLRDYHDLVNGDIRGIDYQEKSREYQALYKRTVDLKNKITGTQTELKQATWNPYYREYSKHLTSPYGVFMISLIVSALNAIFPSLITGKLQLGAFLAGAVAGFGGTYALKTISPPEHAAIIQTVVGQALNIAVTQLLTKLAPDLP